MICLLDNYKISFFIPIAIQYPMFNKLLNVKELIGKYYRYAYVDVYLIY